MKAIIGKKVGMSQIFDANGKVIPVTVIEAGPCVVVQKKTAEKDGYNAIQLGFEDVSEKKLTKPEIGHLNKAGAGLKKTLREFNLDNAAELELGAVIKADTFQVGDKISVVLQADDSFYLPETDIEVLYVIRDKDGKVLSSHISRETQDWKALWYDDDYHNGELDLPSVPAEAGNYTLSIYFNNCAVASTSFTIA